MQCNGEDTFLLGCTMPLCSVCGNFGRNVSVGTGILTTEAVAAGRLSLSGEFLTDGLL